MPPSKRRSSPVFKTPWFQIYSHPAPGSTKPHYSIQAPDFVVVIATNPRGHLLLVRQFRPAFGGRTLELPSGHVEPGDSPEQAARRELFEETAHEADRFELLATLSPSTARFTNRLWCFLATKARPCPGASPESGIELVFHRKGLESLLKQKEFCSSHSYGALGVALLKGRLKARRE